MLVVAVVVMAPGRAAAARSLLSSASGALWAANLDLLSGVEIPAEIAVPDGHSLHGGIRAEGHQHYQFNGTAWVLTNATAKLYNSPTGTDAVGRHFFLEEPDALGGQPTWETINEHHLPALISAVTANSVVAHPVDPDSITWNLLAATSHYGNAEEPLGPVTFVQRILTRRGLPPSTTEGVSTGAIHSSKYYAVYTFYVQRR
ncbi:hypothetical protein GOP47_0011335 [Adiantum capillus-veneris]|uniref:DUF3455 domain-containing protein n=1 Tax=Adiantum capillus-veneris TaxID=13818 RepID=A0A9D4UT12_ADICA|nr:hypothetical protein GOP47_0011335 [Adiantum capillus-veneris]